MKRKSTKKALRLPDPIGIALELRYKNDRLIVRANLDNLAMQHLVEAMTLAVRSKRNRPRRVLGALALLGKYFRSTTPDAGVDVDVLVGSSGVTELTSVFEHEDGSFMCSK
jgi:hypothetical protein